MSNIQRLLSEVEAGNPAAADQLLPLVYDELRRLAAARLLQEDPGHTLEATALVHEVYLKLLGGEQPREFVNRGHYFAVAAEAMRQILIDHARRKLTVRHGGQCQRLDAPLELAGEDQDPATTLAIAELLNRLAEKHPRAGQVAKLRLCLEMTFREIAAALDLSADTAEADWAYARAWLKRAWQSG